MTAGIVWTSERKIYAATSAGTGVISVGVLQFPCGHQLDVGKAMAEEGKSYPGSFFSPIVRRLEAPNSGAGEGDTFFRQEDSAPPPRPPPVELVGAEECHADAEGERVGGHWVKKVKTTSKDSTKAAGGR